MAPKYFLRIVPLKSELSLVFKYPFAISKSAFLQDIFGKIEATFTLKS